MAQIVESPTHSARSKETDEARDATNAMRNKRKVRDLKARLDNRPRMAKASERALVAMNLWRLLERIERGGIKKSEVVKSWRPGANTDSTKRLYTYVLSPDLPEEERTLRENQLTQKVAGYRALAEHAAKLMSTDADEFLKEIFQGTWYLSDSDLPPDELDAPWVSYIRDLLSKMCDWTAKRNNIAEYFAKIESENLSVGDNEGPWGIEFIRHGGDQYIGRLKLGELLHSSRVGDCLPSILLSRKTLQSINGEMLISQRTEVGVMAPEQCKQHANQCEIVTCLELYLALAPLGPESAPQGAFELRIVTDIRTEEGFTVSRLALFEDYFDEIGGGASRPLNEWRLVWRRETDDDFNERDIPLWVRATYQEQISSKAGVFPPTFKVVRPPDLKIVRDQLISVSGSRLFLEMDLANTYRFLGRDYAPEFTDGELSDCEAWAAGLGEFADDTPVMSPERTLAGLIEKNLYTSDESCRLDKLLDERANFLATKVINYLKDRRGKLEKFKLETLNRYEKS